jgi:alkaline phosphatase D
MTQAFHWHNIIRRRGSRRDFLAVSRDVAGVLALGSLSSCRGGREPRFRSYPFTLGVASGDPQPNGVVLWTRLAPEPLAGGGLAPEPFRVRWEVAADDRFARIVRDGASEALPELAHSVHVEADGLEPDRVYWYRFIAGGEVSAVGRTKTAPPVGSHPTRLNLALASCQNYEHGYYTAFRHMADEDLDLVIHVGDYIYEARYSENVVVPEREYPGPESVTLEQYRHRYSFYKLDPDLQAAHAAAPWAVTWDDHDVANNYAGAVSQDDQPPEQFLLRRAAAYQVYYEHLPLRRAAMPHGPDALLYRRLRFGDLIELSLLDTRQYRTDQPCGDGQKPRCAEAYDPGATMMGPVQEQWLMNGMRESTAQWNVLANQVVIAQLARVIRGERTFSMDKWDGYVVARKRLLDFFAAARPSNPVVLTGDIHSNWVADLKTDFDDPSSATVATEFIGTSITSSGDGEDGAEFIQAVHDENPHVKFYNGQRGYVRCSVTPGRWTSDFRVVPYVSRPGAPRSRSKPVGQGRSRSERVGTLTRKPRCAKALAAALWV